MAVFPWKLEERGDAPGPVFGTEFERGMAGQDIVAAFQEVIEQLDEAEFAVVGAALGGFIVAFFATIDSVAVC